VTVFVDPAGFAFAAALQARWRLIRQELLELDAPLLELHRIGDVEQYAETLLRNNGWTRSWQVESTVPNPDWLTYGLSYQGILPDGAERKMPATSRLLLRLRGCQVCAFSLLRAGSFIAPHTHPELAGRFLTLHLGLDLLPERSYLSCESETREEKPGGVVIFDGARQHFAVNMSKQDRVILYMEFSPGEARFED
jgi:aspartyl/asparaginyl beta-hydroxylase (cupin superfamily)